MIVKVFILMKVSFFFTPTKVDFELPNIGHVIFLKSFGREGRLSFLKICQNVKSIPEGLCILLSGGVVILTRTDPLPSLILGNQSVAFGWTHYL